jgi:mono/diheme cytochrome c family protein
MRVGIGIVIGLAVACVVAIAMAASMNMSASKPGSLETAVVTRLKFRKIGGKGVTDPLPDTPATLKMGAEHFQHHCGVCHGLDGQNTGVPFADKMSPPVANLASPRVQKYTDGQLKWIIENGIRLTGMPGWKGVLEDDESWAIVRYLRHLPAKGSLGIPEVYREAEEEHQNAESGASNASEQQHHHETKPEAAPQHRPH